MLQKLELSFLKAILNETSIIPKKKPVPNESYRRVKIPPKNKELKKIKNVIQSPATYLSSEIVDPYTVFQKKKETQKRKREIVHAPKDPSDSSPKVKKRKVLKNIKSETDNEMEKRGNDSPIEVDEPQNSLKKVDLNNEDLSLLFSSDLDLK